MKLCNLIFVFIFIFLPKIILSCEITHDSLALLSGPISHYFYYHQLLKKKEVKYLTTFSGFSQKEFSGLFIQGGIFISPQYLEQMKKSYLFYDKSEYLRSLFSKIKSNKSFDLMVVSEFDTFGLDPFSTYLKAEELVRTILKDCQKIQTQKKNELEKIQKKVLGMKFEKATVLFYLGELFPHGRAPARLMIGDSIALFFKKNNLFETYPTELAYLPWSEKVLTELRKKKKPLIHIGLTGRKSHPSDSFEKISIKSYQEKGELYLNIYGAGVLIPGIYQIYVIEKLADYLTHYFKRDKSQKKKNENRK